MRKKVLAGVLAAVVLLAGGWRLVRTLTCYENPVGASKFRDGEPAASAAYVPALYGPSRSSVLTEARAFPGNAELGRLRWAAAHRVVAPQVPLWIMSDGSPDALTARIAGVRGGTVIIMTSLGMVHDPADDVGFTTHGAFTGALRISDGQVLWTRADGGIHGEPIHLRVPATPLGCGAAAQHRAAARPRYTYQTDDTESGLLCGTG